jgi:hypothetical protein
MLMAEYIRMGRYRVVLLSSLKRYFMIVATDDHGGGYS